MLVDLNQNTTEWEAFRRNKIGASDVPVIMGVSPWSSPIQLWEQKLGIVPPKIKTFRMQRGSDLESTALRCFNEKHGLSLQPQVIICRSYPWAMSSLDGIDVEMKTILEIKCPGEVDHKQACYGQVPDKYIPQLMHQMFCAEVEFAYYYSFDGENGVTLKVERDDEYIKKMIEKELEFYKCLSEFIPPRMTEKDYIIKNDPDWKEASERYLNVKMQLSALEKLEETYRLDLLKKASGNSCKGSGVRLTKYVKRGTVDYKNIPEIQSVDLDQYRKNPIISWRISEE